MLYVRASDSDALWILDGAKLGLIRVCGRID